MPAGWSLAAPDRPAGGVALLLGLPHPHTGLPRQLANITLLRSAERQHCLAGGPAGRARIADLLGRDPTLTDLDREPVA